MLFWNLWKLQVHKASVDSAHFQILFGIRSFLFRILFADMTHSIRLWDAHTGLKCFCFFLLLFFVLLFFLCFVRAVKYRFLSRRGGSNEFPQSLFLSRNKDNNLYTCYYIQGSLRDAISPAAEWQWSGLKIQCSNWRSSVVTLTFSLHCWVMGSAHHLAKANIWPKFNKYLSKGSGDMEWTWNLKAQTRDLQLWPWPWVGMLELWVLHIALLRQTFDQSFMKIFQRAQEIWSKQERDGWSSVVTLTLSASLSYRFYSSSH